MKSSSTETRKIGQCKSFHTVVFVLAMISFTLNNSNARAASVMPSDYRLGATAVKFDDIWQFAVAFKMRPRRRLRSRHLELAMGPLSTSQENRLFMSLDAMSAPRDRSIVAKSGPIEAGGPFSQRQTPAFACLISGRKK